MPAATPKATRIELPEMTITISVSALVNSAPPTPRTRPTRQPATEIISASSRNCARMSFWRAPIAMRMPISRVRSVTETSMMFMIPMPPTNSETEAIAPSSTDITRVVSAAESAAAARLRR